MSDDAQKQKDVAQRLAELEELSPLTFEEYEAVVRKWMIIPDKYILMLIPAFYVVHRLGKKAVWLMVIAPSGGGKTELLNTALIHKDVHEISSLTPQTFLSGMQGKKDPSLLNRIGSGVLLFKDWTMVLSMYKEALAEIMGQLREIWDGSLTKEFGNGLTRTWAGKISVLAACTEAVDMAQKMFTHLGERFVYYRPLMPGRKEIARKALDNEGSQDQMKTEMQNAAYAFFKHIDLEQYTELPPLPKEEHEDLISLADLVTRSRSGVIRDIGGRKEVLFVPSPEMPTRLLQGVAALGSGAMVLRGGDFDDYIKGFMYKMLLDSVPRSNLMVLMEMARHDGQTTAEIATALGYPTETIKTYLENQALLQVCSRMQSVGRGDKWTMKEEYVTLIRKYKEIEKLTDDEIKARLMAQEDDEPGTFDNGLDTTGL